MDCIPRVAGTRCGTYQARASMLISDGQPTEAFHSLSRSTHRRDPARQAVQEWGWGSEEGFRASTFAAPRDEHVPPAGLGCRRRCVGRQWKPRPRKLWPCITLCTGRPPAELTPRGGPMAPPGLPLGRWIMAGATGRRCDASRTIQPDLFLTGAATWDLYISDLAYYISRRAYGHDDADGRGRSHQHDDMRPLYIRPCLLYITGLRA